jgi:hypothetical protein
MSAMGERDNEKVCLRCGASFACGMDAEAATLACWCQDLPPLVSRSDGDCVCPSCLRAAIAEEQAA